MCAALVLPVAAVGSYFGALDKAQAAELHKLTPEEAAQLIEYGPEWARELGLHSVFRASFYGTHSLIDIAEEHKGKVGDQAARYLEAIETTIRAYRQTAARKEKPERLPLTPLLKQDRAPLNHQHPIPLIPKKEKKEGEKKKGC